MKNKRFKKFIALITGAVLLTGSLTACGVSGSVAESKSSVAENQSAEKKDNGELAVSFPTGNIRVAINILALQKGYFKEEGVTVKPVAIGGNDALTAINQQNDTLDILTAGFVPDVQAIGSGYDLKFVAGTAVEGGAIITKKGNADKYRGTDKKLNVDAVTSAKIGFVRNEASWIVTRQYLLDNGVSADTIKDIEAENSGKISYYGEATETALAVQKGEIELGFLPMEFALLYADSYGLEVVVAAGDLLPNYVCCREVTSAKAFDEKFDSFVAYETARIRAFEYYKKGEKDASVKADVVKIVSDYSGKEKDYVETYLYGGVTKYAVDPNTKGIVDYVKAAYNSGVFSRSTVDFGTYDIKQNVDTSAYKKALDNLIAKNPDNAFYKSLLEEYNLAN